LDVSGYSQEEERKKYAHVLGNDCGANRWLGIAWFGNAWRSSIDVLFLKINAATVAIPTAATTVFLLQFFGSAKKPPAGLQISARTDERTNGQMDE